MNMETMIEIAKIGGPVLAICVVLLWATLRDKDRMARELNADKRLMLDAFNRNTKAFMDFSNQLEKRKCMAGMVRHQPDTVSEGLHG